MVATAENIPPKPRANSALLPSLAKDCLGFECIPLTGTHGYAKSLQSCPTLGDPVDCSPQAPLSIGFPRQEHWSGLPFPPSGDLSNPGIQPTSLMSPALAGKLFITGATWEADWHSHFYFTNPGPCLFKPLAHSRCCQITARTILTSAPLLLRKVWVVHQGTPVMGHLKL